MKKTLEGTIIIETRDPIELRNDNIAYFIASANEMIDKQKKTLSNKIILPIKTPALYGNTQQIKQRNRIYFSMPVPNTSKNFGTEEMW